MKFLKSFEYDSNQRYAVVSGAPLVDSFFASALIPFALLMLATDLSWVGNFAVTFGLLWFFVRGQHNYLNAEKQESLQPEKVLFFWLPAWALLFVLGAWSLVSTPIFIGLAVAITATGTYLAHRYLPWVITLESSEQNSEQEVSQLNDELV